MPKIRHLCMGTLCSGMTLAEAERQGTLSWNGLALDGKLDFYAANCITPDTIRLGDGATAALLFDVVTTSGAAKSRYRLVAVNRYFPGLGPVQLDNLRKTLTDRIGGMQQVPDAGNLWGRSIGDMRIAVMSMLPDPAKKPAKVLTENWVGIVSLAATYSKRVDWTMAQGECKKGMPAL